MIVHLNRQNQLWYQNEAKLIDKATSKENAVDLKYLTDKVEFLANNSSIEKYDPTVGLMQEHIKRKYQSELAKAALAGDPNASQTARNVVVISMIILVIFIVIMESIK